MDIKRKLSDSHEHDVLQNQRKKANYLPESKFYVSVPRLESIVNVKVISILCKQPDVRDAMIQHSRNFDNVQNNFENLRSDHLASLDQIEETILSKLSLLPLPDLLKAEMSNVIRPVELDIFKWLHCLRDTIGHNELKSLGYSIIDSLQWTYQGIVDRAKIMKHLIVTNYDSGLLECKETAKKIYELACTYCLEDVIPSLWEKLDKETKVYFRYLRGGNQMLGFYDGHLVVYWTSVINKKLSGLYNKMGPHLKTYNWEKKESIYKNMFSLALYKGNILAVSYFWKKLTIDEIICNLTQWANTAANLIIMKYLINMKMNPTAFHSTRYQHTNEYADILYFLLSRLQEETSTETQREVIQKNSHVILPSLFLFWPHQQLLLPTMQTMGDLVNKKGYIDLLYTISLELCEGKTTQTQNVLRRIWCESPLNLKQSFIQDVIKDVGGLRVNARNVLQHIIEIGDMKTVKEMMRYLNLEQRKQIVEDVFFPILLHASAFDDQKTSRSDILYFNVKIRQNDGSYLPHRCCLNNNWHIVEKFVNWAFTLEERINYFKYNLIIDKKCITLNLLKQDNYELLDRFLNWCCCTEQDINQFKKELVLSTSEIVKLGENDWCLFEKFIAWSSLSEEEIHKLKLTVLRSQNCIIPVRLGFTKNFQFVDKLINWCCHSNEEIQLFKAECVLSDWFLAIVCGFGENWKLLKKLFSLFSPISEEVKMKLKENIMKQKPLEDVVKHLFCLVDGDTENKIFLR